MKASCALLAAVILSSAACYDPYNTVEARFIGYNATPNRVELIVDGRTTVELKPNGYTDFWMEVLIPDRMCNSCLTEPGLNDEIRVSVVWKNLDNPGLTTTNLTRTIYCQAGRQQQTSITYRIERRGERFPVEYEYLECQGAS